MLDKIQVGFRCSKQLHELLKEEAWRRKLSVQQLIGDAVDAYLASSQASRDATLTQEERDAVERLIFAMRNGDEELVKDMLGFTRTIGNVARARQVQPARQRSRKVG